jgi:hypothetical protein
MGTRKKPKKPHTKFETSEDSFDDHWGKLEAKLSDWVKSTLPKLVKETM